jgi:hypothetical protein
MLTYPLSTFGSATPIPLAALLSGGTQTQKREETDLGCTMITCSPDSMVRLQKGKSPSERFARCGVALTPPGRSFAWAHWSVNRCAVILPAIDNSTFFVPRTGVHKGLERTHMNSDPLRSHLNRFFDEIIFSTMPEHQ